MTNLQEADAQRRRLITPERAVLVLPVLAGLVVAGLLLLFGLSPLLLQVQQRKAVVVEMQAKQDDLPRLKRRLERLLERQQMAQGQQERLFQLVAGTDALTTWLTQVNRFATSRDCPLFPWSPSPLSAIAPLPRRLPMEAPRRRPMPMLLPPPP